MSLVILKKELLFLLCQMILQNLILEMLLLFVDRIT